MKFYSKTQKLIVWYDDKVLCRFNNYEYETEDIKIIKTLKDLGYNHELEFTEDAIISDELEKEKPYYKDLSIRELKEIAKQRGIIGMTNKSKKEILERLEGD